MINDISGKHTFVVCAYRESSYLEECIQSLLAQRTRSTVVISTSTPNQHIRDLADRYSLKLYVSPEKSSLANDWNFAIKCANTELVTLAHQDDVYDNAYSECIWRAYQKSRDPIILFTDYNEIRGSKIVRKNRLLNIKRMMLAPLRLPFLWRSRFVRRRILSLGSAICCPAVTLVKTAIVQPLFENNMKSNIDWQAWELLSRKKGSFVYLPRPLMMHRIHSQSTTSELLQDSARKEEDLIVFRKFWPEPIARLIEKIYQKSEKSNQLNGNG